MWICLGRFLKSCVRPNVIFSAFEGSNTSLSLESSVLLFVLSALRASMLCSPFFHSRATNDVVVSSSRSFSLSLSIRLLS